jgi:methionine-rich copper-binding protein CopC
MVKQWLLAVGATGLFLGGPALGHAKLRSTIPAADARLRTAPPSLTLIFNEDVRLAVLTLTTGGSAIPISIDRSASAAPQVRIKLPVLAAGKYQVNWSALSPDDGHVTKGTFAFEVTDTAAPAAAASR